MLLQTTHREQSHNIILGTGASGVSTGQKQCLHHGTLPFCWTTTQKSRPPNRIRHFFQVQHSPWFNEKKKAEVPKKSQISYFLCDLQNNLLKILFQCFSLEYQRSRFVSVSFRILLQSQVRTMGQVWLKDLAAILNNTVSKEWLV